MLCQLRTRDLHASSRHIHMMICDARSTFPQWLVLHSESWKLEWLCAHQPHAASHYKTVRDRYIEMNLRARAFSARASSDLCGSDTCNDVANGPIPRPLAASTHHGTLIFERGDQAVTAHLNDPLLFFQIIIEPWFSCSSSEVLRIY